MSSDKRTAKLAQINKLLAKAESTDFGPERDALLGKVDELRTEFAVMEWELEQTGEQERVEPIMQQIVVCEAESDIESELVRLFSSVCRFFGGKPVFYGTETSFWDTTAKVIAMPEDIKNIELLYTSLRLQLGRKISPSYDHNKPLVENVQMFKEAGLKWKEIWAVFHAAGAPGADTAEPNRSRLIGWQKKYKEYAEAEGIEPVKTNPTTYKRNFCYGFNEAIADRIAEIVRLRQNKEQYAGGKAGALVLVDHADRVKEKYQEIYGDVKLGKMSGRNVRYNGQAQASGRKAGKSADLGQTKVKGNRGALNA